MCKKMQRKIERGFVMEQKTVSRNKIRTPYAMKIFADVVAMLGLAEEEKRCQTKEDYQALQRKIILEIKKLQCR